MLRWHISRRHVAAGLALVASLASVLSALAIPVRSTITSTGPQGVELVQHDWSPTMSIIVILQVIAAVLALAAALCVFQDRAVWAKRLLLAAAVVGLLPIPVTSSLALVSYYLVRTSPRV
ncbi:hypothetical protein M2302_005133 [Micromonospora sp. A200]|uniref:hypothetical protein n=1 Tax=Micromonospora sp. A200 TaxID=2940568 RepID=UPI0024765395|nr:hypothetical protein [Micromonospora sp. A200]MDH6464932.1 hypothetical protein [Micromonospora sp. A200]